MIAIDGSHGEGGGQLLRNAAALAAVTGSAVTVTDIRAKRPRPGLAAQHVAALRALAAVANAEVSGLEVGSREVTVRPGTLSGGRFRFDVGTAGSVTLVLQACLPAALRAPAATEFALVGGTDVRWSPPADYLRYVFLPLLARMGGHVEVDVVRRGYYPRGGGEIRVRVEPSGALRPLVAEPSGSETVRGAVHTANLPEHVGSRIRSAAAKRLVGMPQPEIRVERLGPGEAVGMGGAAVLWAGDGAAAVGATALAEKGVPAEDVGGRAADGLLAEMRAGVSLDVHASDQILLYCALAEGASTFTAREVSGHAEATMWLLERFLDVSFHIAPEEGRVRFRVSPSRH